MRLTETNGTREFRSLLCPSCALFVVEVFLGTARKEMVGTRRLELLTSTVSR